MGNIIGTDTYLPEVKIIRRAVSFGEYEFQTNIEDIEGKEEK
jgi:hypothetical protein